MLGLPRRTLWFLLVQGELLLAFLLISGWLPRLAWVSARFLFAAFTGIVLIKALRGETSCGCLGAAEIDPRWMLPLDAAFLLGFFVLPTPPALPTGIDRGAPHRLRLARGLIAGLGYTAAALFASYALAFLTPATLGADGEILASTASGSNVIALRPEQWQGRRLPIAKYIETPVDFMHGRWQLVFVRAGCRHCEEALPRYEALARSRLSFGGGEQTLIVEIPPVGTQRLLPDDSVCEYGTLPAEHVWDLPTPTELELRDGVVTFSH